MKTALIISLFAGVLVTAGFVQQQKDCCAGEKAVKAQTADCAGKTAASCATKPSAEHQFLAEAKKMEMQAQKLETGKDECCKSTEVKPMLKGDPGCCNAKDEPAKFKVFIAGMGYKYFGCEESAGKERQKLIAKHARVGKVQKVTSKVSIS